MIMHTITHAVILYTTALFPVTVKATFVTDSASFLISEGNIKAEWNKSSGD